MADFTGSFSGSFTGSYDILTHSDEYNGTTYGYVLHQRVGTGKAEKILLSDFFRDWLGSESGSAGIQDYGAGGYIFDSDRILIRSGSYVGSTFRPILKTATISNLFGGYSNGSLRNTFIYARGVGRNTEASPTISSSMVLTVGGQILYEDNDGVGDLHGLTLTILEATDFSKVSTTRYNTALGGATAAADSLATAIDGMSPTEIGVITSLGHWETYLSNNLRTAAKKVGLSKLGGYVSTDSGSAYAAVFYGTSGSAGVSDSLERLVAYRFTTGSNLDIPTATITTRVQSNTHGIYPFVNISDASSTNALYRYSADTSSVLEPALLVNSDGEIESLGDVVTFKSDTATITLDMSSSSDTFLFVDGYVSTSGHIVPSATELYDLGSTDLRWRDLYLSGSTIYLGSSTLSSLGGKTSGSFTGSFSGDGSNLVNVPGNSGTVTSITAGSGLNGGTITTSGTVSVDSGSMLPYYSSSTFNTVSGDATITSTGVISVVSSSYALTASHALNAGGGGSTSPGGSDGQVQYNNGGSFGGAAQLYYDDGNDRVGIGTASPASLLEVQYTSGTGTIRIDQNEVAQGLYFTGRTGYDDYSIDLANTNGLRFYNRGTSNTELQLRDGKVGIGTTSPGTPLHISRDAGSSTFTRFTREDLTDESWDQRIDAGGTLEIRSVTDAGLTVLNAFQLEHATGNLTLKGWIRSEDGSAGDPTYSFSNDTNTGMYLATTDELAFSTAGAGRMRIDPDGNVGIGNTNPSASLGNDGVVLQIGNTAAGQAGLLTFGRNFAERAGMVWRRGTNTWDTAIFVDGTENLIIHTDYSAEPLGGADIVFKHGTSEIMRMVDTDVGIGTSSPLAKLDVSTTANDGVDVLAWDTTQAQGANLRLGHSLNATVGTQTALTVNDVLGKLLFAGSDGTAFYDGAAIIADATQNYTGTNGGTRLEFYTTPTNTKTLTPQMMIDESGNVGIGVLDPDSTLEVNGSVHINTNTAANPLNISRSGNKTQEALQIGVTDRVAQFTYVEDTTNEGNNDFGMYDFYLGGNDGETTARMLTLDGNSTQKEVVVNQNQADIDFRVESDTNANALFVRASDGNVGIGTASPAEKLQVNGNLLLSGSGDVTLHISADTDNVTETHNPLLRLSQDGNLLNMDIGMAGDVDQLFTGQLQNSGYLWVKGYDFQIAYGNAGGGNDAITVLNSNGRVGIGTTAPDSNLEIYAEGANATRQMLHVNSTLTSGTSTGATLSYPASITSTVSGGTAISRVMNWVKIDANAANNNTVMNRNLISTDSGTTYQVGGMDLYSSNHFDATRRALFVHSSNVPIWFTAASNVSTQTGENSGSYVQMALTTAGDVGIGTTAPGYPLQVNGVEVSIITSGSSAGYTQGAIALSSGTDNNPQFRGQGTFLFNQANDTTWYIGTNYLNADTFTINRKASTTNLDTSTAQLANAFFTILNDGNVGIGTTSPTVPLQVAGAISSSGIIYTTNQVRSDTYASLAFSSNSFLKFDDDNLEGTNGTVLASIASMGFIIDTNNNGSSDEFIWMVDNTDASAATELMRLTDDGNLGIGTTSPGAELDVVGSISSNDGAIYRDGGTVTHVLSPKGGYLDVSGSPTTGAFKIVLPHTHGDTVNTGENSMMTMWVDIYDYNGGGNGESISLFLGGYTYINDGNRWINTHATIVSGRHDRNINVYFGNDTSNYIIWIGDFNSTWDHPSLQIRDVKAGWNNENVITETWSVSLVTSLAAGEEQEETSRANLTATRVSGSGTNADNRIIYTDGTTGNIQASSAFTFTGAGPSGTGNLFVSADTDSYADIGRTRIGYSAYSDHANFSHVDMTAAGQYAVVQDASGTTFLNAASGQSIRFRINNSPEGLWNSTGLRIGDETAPSYTLDVNGTFRTTGNAILGDGTDSHTVNGTMNFAQQTANITFPDITSIPETPTTEKHRYITFAGSNGGISQVTGRGGIMISSKDDSLILANGDVGRGYINGTSADKNGTTVTAHGEEIYMFSDGGIQFWTGLQAGFSRTNSPSRVYINGSGSMFFVGESPYIYFNDTNTRLGEGAGNSVRVTTNSGYCEIGPQNTSYSHFQTDRALFYFSTEAVFDNAISSYDADFVIRRGGPAGTRTTKMTIGSSNVQFVDDIVPDTDDTGNVGTAALTWNNGRFTNLTVDSTMTVTSTLNVRAAIDLEDGDVLRFGDGDDVEFFFNGTNFYLDLNAGGNNFYIRDATTTRFTFDDNGTFTATTDVIVSSDIRLKNELPDTVQGLEAVDKMRPIKYTLKDDEDENPKTHLGFSAQELLDIVPEVVRQGDDDYYSVAYQKLVPVLVKAIQELTEEVRELKKKVEE